MAPGRLTIRGVTRTVRTSVQIRLSGGQAQAAAKTSFLMTDFGIEPPQHPFVAVEPQVTLDLKLRLVKTAAAPAS